VFAVPLADRAASGSPTPGTRRRAETGPARPIPEVGQVNSAGTDARVVLRTDTGAGGSSHNGLPQPLVDYRGATPVVDDPTVITALSCGGYAATAFLNTNLVEALARQIQ